MKPVKVLRLRFRHINKHTNKHTIFLVYIFCYNSRTTCIASLFLSFYIVTTVSQNQLPRQSHPNQFKRNRWKEESSGLEMPIPSHITSHTHFHRQIMLIQYSKANVIDRKANKPPWSLLFRLFSSNTSIGYNGNTMIFFVGTSTLLCADIGDF